MGLPPTGGGDARGGHTGGGDLCFLSTEYGHKIHCDHTHYGLVSGGGATPGDKSVKVLVGAVVPGPVGDAYGGPDGKTGTIREGLRGGHGRYG